MFTGFVAVFVFVLICAIFYLSEFIIVDNKIVIKYFDYNNGENWSITYEILEKSDSNDR